MKHLILLSLLALSFTANATLPLPSNPTARPPGFRHPSVEGVRIGPDTGCTFDEFKNELQLFLDMNPGLFSIERFENVALRHGGSVQYAVVYSEADKVFSVNLMPISTTSDGSRLQTLRNLTIQDKELIKTTADLTSNTLKSGAYRNALVAYYRSVYDDILGCSKFTGFEYKARLSGIPANPITSAFVNSAIGWNTKPALTATQKAAMENTTIAVIDGTWNTASVLPNVAAKLEVISGYMDQPFATAEVPTTKSSTTDVTHANTVVNTIGDLTDAKMIVIPTAEDGDYVFGGGIHGDTRMSAIANSLEWVISNATAKGIDIVVVASEIPQDTGQKRIYDQYETLREKGISVIQAGGNDGVAASNPREQAYPDLLNEQGSIAVNGAPNIIAGSFGREGAAGSDAMVTSNYGLNDTMVWTGANSSLLPTRVGTTNQNINLSAANDNSLTMGSYGKSSVAATLTAVATTYAKAVAPWLTPDQIKVAISQSGDQSPAYRYALADFPSYEKLQEELARFNLNRGGVLNAKDLYDYIKAYYSDYDAAYIGYVSIRDPAYPLGYVLQPMTTTALLTTVTDDYYSPAEACNKPCVNQPLLDMTCAVTIQPTVSSPGICKVDTRSESGGTILTTTITHKIFIEIATHSIHYYSDSWDDLITTANIPEKDIFNTYRIFEKDTTHPYGWWATWINTTNGAIVQSNVSLNPQWKCDWKNTWGGTLQPTPPGGTPDTQRLCHVTL